MSKESRTTPNSFFSSNISKGMQDAQRLATTNRSAQKPSVIPQASTSAKNLHDPVALPPYDEEKKKAASRRHGGVTKQRKKGDTSEEEEEEEEEDGVRYRKPDRVSARSRATVRSSSSVSSREDDEDDYSRSSSPREETKSKRSSRVASMPRSPTHQRATPQKSSTRKKSSSSVSGDDDEEDEPRKPIVPVAGKQPRYTTSAQVAKHHIDRAEELDKRERQLTEQEKRLTEMKESMSALIEEFRERSRLHSETEERLERRCHELDAQSQQLKEKEQTHAQSEEILKLVRPTDVVLMRAARTQQHSIGQEQFNQLVPLLLLQALPHSNCRPVVSSTKADNYVTIVVRDDSEEARVLFQQSISCDLLNK